MYPTAREPHPRFVFCGSHVRSTIVGILEVPHDDEKQLRRTSITNGLICAFGLAGLHSSSSSDGEGGDPWNDEGASSCMLFELDASTRH